MFTFAALPLEHDENSFGAFCLDSFDGKVENGKKKKKKKKLRNCLQKVYIHMFFSFLFSFPFLSFLL